MADNKSHARYLQNPYGDVQLVVAGLVDAKRASGWLEPVGLRPNGTSWNDPEDQAGIDAAGASMEARSAYESSKDVENPAEPEKGFFARIEQRIEDDVL
jgi:hypothetical protein